ncbi:MAG: DNA polymerase IV [Lachnospiraceae bacterium]|nr:DNA polymerase IV [Lachnospiraceae bacterium]
MDRAILHCDMNNFYASVECMLDPSLKDKPVAVCGSQKDRHGIVLAKNYHAKDYGVKTGDTIWQAKNKCKDIVIIETPHFDEYAKYSKLARNLYREYTDLVEPMGLDECWLDVTASTKLFGPPEKIANELREKVKSKFNLTISVGVSFNKTFAKLGSDMKKPDATTIITRDNYKTVVWPLPVSDLFGVGRRTNEKLKQQFIYTIGDLANTKKERLKNLFGKNGIYLYEAANGLENDEVQKYDELDEVKSISHGITTVKDLENDDEVWEVMLELAQEIGYKLRSKELRANGVYVSIRDDKLFWEQYQKRLRSSEQSAINIAKYAFKLFKERYDWERNIRTVTIGVTNLSSEDKPEQLSVFDCIENKSKIEKAEKVMEELNLRYGEEIVKNATLLKNDNLPNSRRKMKYNGEK